MDPILRKLLLKISKFMESFSSILEDGMDVFKVDLSSLKKFMSLLSGSFVAHFEKRHDNVWILIVHVFSIGNFHLTFKFQVQSCINAEMRLFKGN